MDKKSGRKRKTSNKKNIITRYFRHHNAILISFIDKKKQEQAQNLSLLLNIIQ